MKGEPAYIIYAKRSPIGRFKGALSSVRVDDLLAKLFVDVKNHSGINPDFIDDVIVGCANQAGEDNRNLARMSSLLAQFPMSVPGTTLNRLCGSSMDAAIYAVSKIAAGMGDCFVVGGAESMTRAPLVMSKAESNYSGTQKIYDTTLGWRFPNPAMEKMFPLFNMGETAEELVSKYGLSREEQDLFAFESHQKAVSAQENGRFDSEILPIDIPGQKKKPGYTFSKDESPRKETSLEKLAALKAVFRKDGTVTAGNSSSLNDGAAALVIVSESFLKKHQLNPLAKVTGVGVCGVHPNTMGIGPVMATRKLCERHGQKISDFDLIELNEAFAAQALSCIKELELDPAIVNLNGGAIALGHPLGCSGARIITTLVHQMKGNPKYKKGLATMCIGVGQGISFSVESL
ncbi:MAG: acetyl-CoA C-acyltransferase [Bacteriovoracaceae bacterium]|jgi:acetyl-CoA acyltransferase|nr:acetyl-CoA C-acyltransferase [Bacteriovoracaceae bacterium]